MLAGVISGLKIALMIIGFALWFWAEFPILGGVLIILDLAWIGGLFPVAYEFFARFSGDWWLGLALGLGGTLAAAFGLLAFFSKLFCGKEDEPEAAVALLERKRKSL